MTISCCASTEALAAQSMALRALGGLRCARVHALHLCTKVHTNIWPPPRGLPRGAKGVGAGGGVPFPVAPLPFPQGVIRRAWPPGALRVNLPSAFLADEAMWPPSCSAWRRTTTLSFSSFLLFSLGGVMEIATGGGGGAGLKRECVAARGGGACEERD